MSANCAFCSVTFSKYSCPKCNVLYCSLKCYRSPRHVDCSEKFYKEAVKEELELRSAEDQKDPAAKARMIQTLQKIHGEDIEYKHEDDINDLDSDDDVDLAERMAGVDLDDAEEVWKCLTKEERRDFEKLVNSGDIDKVVPKFEPWWSSKIDEKLIQEVGEENKVDIELKMRCPTIESNVASFHTIFKATPSPMIKFGLLNVLYSYAYGVLFFCGDHGSKTNLFKFVELLLTLSDNLGKAANFDNADSSLESAASNVNIHNFWTISPKFTRDVKKDVFKIIQGPSKRMKNFYIHSALSDLNRLLTKAAKSKKSGEDSNDFDKVKTDLPPWKQEKSRPIELDRKTVKLAAKKIEFYFSWINEYPDEYNVLRT